MSGHQGNDNRDGGVGRVSTDATRTLTFSTPAQQRSLDLAEAPAPILILIRGTPQGCRYTLDGQSRFVLGRDATADIQLNDANISRHHLELTIDNGRLFAADMGSRNGSFLNDEAIGQEKIELAKEDMLTLGSTILKYLPAGEFETLYHINLADAAHRDKVTDLFNRTYISEVLDVEFKRAKALHTSLSLVFFDIDDFKKINDTHGHDAGDQVLAALGSLMRTLGLRERDLVGRYGGEEFLAVLTSADAVRAVEVAEHIRRTIETHAFSYDGWRIPVTVSLGVATISPRFSTAAELCKEADRALYESKRNGKNRVTASPT